MKHLYIRFFANKEDTMPRNSDRLSKQGELDANTFILQSVDECIIN